jgi:putative transposase
MCRVLGISRSGYYAWRDRPVSARAAEDAQLAEAITGIWEASGRTYGRPRITAALADEHDRHVAQKRVGRLMAGAGIQGVTRRRKKVATTRSDGSQPAPDLVQRHWRVEGPDQLWVADITYIPTLVGFLYLAVVLDAFSRRVIGWAMAAHLRSELVTDALNMAIAVRRPTGVIHHSDYAELCVKPRNGGLACCDGVLLTGSSA